MRGAVLGGLFALGGIGCSAESVGSDGEESAENIRAEPPEFPIVLVHAFHATTTNAWSMEPVANELRRAGGQRDDPRRA